MTLIRIFTSVKKNMKRSCKALASAKKTDGTAMTVKIKENAINKTFCFAPSLYFDFFKHHVYHCRLREDLVVRPELNSSFVQ